MSEASTEQFVGRRVSVKLGDGTHKNGEILKVNESGIIGSFGPRNPREGMRPRTGETAEIRFDDGWWSEVSTMQLTFI